MKNRYLFLAVALSGCVDHDPPIRANWARMKRNADAADACYKLGGKPHQNLWNEEVDGCLMPAPPAPSQEKP